jgi:glycine cleavage system aminomethyltransferase T
VQKTGAARRIRGLRFEGSATPSCREPWPLQAAGSFAGEVTSAVWSPRLEANLALAMVERDYWDAGTAVTVTLPDGSRRAGAVCELPFADPPGGV